MTNFELKQLKSNLELKKQKIAGEITKVDKNKIGHTHTISWVKWGVNC